MGALFGWALLGRELLSVDVSRDRGELYQRNGDRIRNDYSLTLLNKTEAPVEVSLRAVAAGAPALTWHGAHNVVLQAGEVANVPFRLEAIAADLRTPRFDVDVVACTAAQVCAHERSRFFGPPPS
jgi:polyferredoxin